MLGAVSKFTWNSTTKQFEVAGAAVKWNPTKNRWETVEGGTPINRLDAPINDLRSRVRPPKPGAPALDASTSLTSKALIGGGALLLLGVLVFAWSRKS